LDCRFEIYDECVTWSELEQVSDPPLRARRFRRLAHLLHRSHRV